MWNEQYENFSKYDQGEFSRLSNYLLSHTYLVRDIYLIDKQYTERSEDYRKVSRMFDCLRDYFAVSGFRLEKDENYGVISLSTEEHNRARNIGRFTTLFLYVCRLIYEEGREQGDRSHIVRTDTSTVIEKMRTFGLLNKGKSTWTERKSAQVFLTHFNIIQKTENAWSKDGNGLLIFPSILSIISNQGINNMVAELEDMKSDDMNNDPDEEEYEA